MKLAHHQDNPPSPNGDAKRTSQRISKNKQATSVKHSQQRANNKLRVLESRKGHERPRNLRQDQRADKGARHGAGKGEVVVGTDQALAHGLWRERGAVDEHVVRGLQGEGLLDFGVGGEEEVEERDEEKEGVEEDVCKIDVSQGSWSSGLAFYN